MAKPSLWEKIVVLSFIATFMVGILWAEEPIELKSSHFGETREESHWLTIEIDEEEEVSEEEPVEKEKRESSPLQLKRKSSYPKLPLLKSLPLSGMKANKKIISRLLKDLKSKNPALRCWAARSLGELDIQKERGKAIRALKKAFRKEKHPLVKEAIKEVLLKLEGELPETKAFL